MNFLSAGELAVLFGACLGTAYVATRAFASIARLSGADVLTWFGRAAARGEGFPQGMRKVSKDDRRFLKLLFGRRRPLRLEAARLIVWLTYALVVVVFMSIVQLAAGYSDPAYQVLARLPWTLAVVWAA